MNAAGVVALGVLTALLAQLLWDALSHWVPWIGGVPAGQTA